MTRRIDVLLAEIKRVRADMQTRGSLSDASKPEAQLVRLVDELAFIMKAQFTEIEKVKREVKAKRARR